MSAAGYVTIETRVMSEKLRDIRALAAHPSWTDELLPHLQELLNEHTEAALSPSLHKDFRSQHIEAVHVLRSLIDFPQTREKQLEASWKQSQKKPPTA